MDPTLKQAIANLNRARRELEATVRAELKQPKTNISYEDWKAERLERVSTRCGGRPTFIGSRIQPCDVYCLNPKWADDMRTAAHWGVNAEDIEHAKRFCIEEPHWQMLRSGYDHVQGRKLTDEQYEALQTKWNSR